MPCGDFNGHVGKEYEGVHGGSGCGVRNADGDRILDFACANNLVIVTYQSGNANTQIDFILLRKQHLKLTKDIKVIPENT